MKYDGPDAEFDAFVEWFKQKGSTVFQLVVGCGIGFPVLECAGLN